MFDYSAFNKKLAPYVPGVFATAITLSVIYALALLGVIGLGHGATSEAAAALDIPDAAKSSGLSAKELSDRIRGKAVFRSGRGVSEKTVDELGRFVFKWAIQDRDGVWTAYLEDTKRKEGGKVRVSVGEQVGGRYKVLDIDSSGVLVQEGAEQKRLTK